MTSKPALLQKLHIDLPLLVALLALIAVGLVILYSAANQNMMLVQKQSIRLIVAALLGLLAAQIPPQQYRIWAPWLFVGGLILLVATLMIGHIGKGAQRWLNLGIIRVQPSEIMKLGIPLILAWFLSERPLPPRFKTVILCLLIVTAPILLTAIQPDLGTAILLAAAAGSVLLLAGISVRFIVTSVILALAALPVLWSVMHDYQRQRVLTFLNPERDPLGNGYHIIQSKIAIGSGGIFGKGWLEGTQSHLQFLPEHATDFIFAVAGEEFGLLGTGLLILLYLAIAGRCLYIGTQAQDTFTRLLAGSIGLTFFLSVFINVGMVTGLLPVVGLPLPLVSYGGSSMVTILVSMGIVMSIHHHRKLVG